MRAVVIAAALLLLPAAAPPPLKAQTRPQRGSPAGPTKQTAPQKETALEEVGDGDVLRVTTELVSVPVAVMDRGGRYIFDMRREEFHVYEDGVEQPIAHFSDVEQPFSVVLLMDTSSSTVSYLGEIRQAAEAFIAQLRPNDTVLPVTFDGMLHPLLNIRTRDRKRLSASLSRMRSDEGDNGTKLYDAVEFAYRAFKYVPGRRAVLLFTDGEDTWSNTTAKGTLDDATEADVLVYAIHYGPPPSTDYLAALAERSGGRFYQATDVEEIKQYFGAVAEELRHQYSLGYYPKKSPRRGRERRIKVKVDRPEVAVKTRKSYLH